MLQKWRLKRAFSLLPALLAAGLVLFPFDWLGTVWPAYAQVFDRVFATALAHEIGHTTLFLLAGLALLFTFPRLRQRPVLYLVIMALGAVSEEALQDLFKRNLPSIGDGHDLLLDLIGFVVAYVVVFVALWGKALFQKEERKRV